MRSESTIAFGHPSETKPTFGGVARLRRRADFSAGFIGRFRASSLSVERKKNAAARRRGHSSSGLYRPPATGQRRRLFLLRRALAAPLRGRAGEREVLEHVAGLRLHLLLHLHEQVLALLDV